jgi:hypothetical protein
VRVRRGKHAGLGEKLAVELQGRQDIAGIVRQPVKTFGLEHGEGAAGLGVLFVRLQTVPVWNELPDPGWNLHQT